jgi:hypothetical protein
VRQLAELTTEIADLAEAVVRTALHVKINAVIADTVEVDRTAQALRSASGRTTETIEQVKLMPGSAAAMTCDVPLVEMEETTSFTGVPQQDNCAGDPGRVETELFGELSEAACGEPKVASVRDDTAIGARVLELYDRLGGFIKPT